MTTVIYNTLKLCEYRSKFHNLKVLIIGAGAVGTYLLEYLSKMGVSPDAIDFDYFTLENAGKHSCLIRTPDDAGFNKAQIASYRVQPLLDDGCSSNGVDTDLCLLGPQSLSDYRVVFAAVDNYDAKILLNELVRQIPERDRPVLVMAGTNKEFATSIILDNHDFCLRCLIDASWLNQSSKRTSCVGPQIRSVNDVNEIVRTSNLASSMAAHLASEQFRSYIIGTNSVMNRCISYNAYPDLELTVTHPLTKADCPGCAVTPPINITFLPGSILDTTLGQALEQIRENLGSTDFEIAVHKLNYSNQIFNGFIVDDVCHCCGDKILILKHEGRTYLDDLKCDVCRTNQKLTHLDSTKLLHGSVIYAFTYSCDNLLKSMKLFELGYPLGAHISVIERNGAFDVIDSAKNITTIFSYSDDRTLLHSLRSLGGKS